MRSLPTPPSRARSDELFLVVASSAALVAAGINRSSITAVPLVSFNGDPTKTDEETLALIMIGRVSTTKSENADEVRLQLVHLSQALEAIRQMSKGEIAAIVKQLQPAIDRQDRDRFKLEYGLLTVEEVAERMKCTSAVVCAREVSGEIFAARASGRDSALQYPNFQFDDRVDKSLLQQVIQKYRDANVSHNLLWSFLRSRHKIFADWTPLEVMMGALPPAFASMTSEEWTEAFLDVVDEEISRVR